MRLAFFGSDEFALPSLRAIQQEGHTIALVITQPDRPAGRGQQVQPTPVKVLACEWGIPVYTFETLRDGKAKDLLQACAVDLAVVVAYGRLIPKEMLAIPRHGFINLHPSLLPKYRGPAPVPHAILAGEKETGVSIFRLNERLDAGDLLDRVSVPILPDDTSATLLARLATLGASRLVHVIHALKQGEIHPIPQCEAEATHAPKLKKEDGIIRWTQPAERLERMIRAFQPWPLATTFVPTSKGPRRIAILQAAVEGPPCSLSGRPGEILLADSHHGLIIQCGDRPLRILRLQPESRPPMDACAFLRGTPLEVGTILLSAS